MASPQSDTHAALPHRGHGAITALILARGRGTSLRPLTYTRPRHVLPVGNRPHLEHVLDLLRKHGIERAVVLGHATGSFEQVVEASRRDGFDVRIERETALLGTAGAIKAVQHLIRGDTFLVVNGDVLTDADLGALLSFHHAQGAVATVMGTRLREEGPFGVIESGADGRVLSFVEKPDERAPGMRLVNAGFYVLERSALDLIPKGAVWSIERELLPDLIETGDAVYSLEARGYWRHIHTLPDYLQANLDHLMGLTRTERVGTSPGKALIDDYAVVDDSSSVYLSCIGEGAVVEAGACVDRSVVLPGAVIGRRAHVRGSIVGVGARVLAGAHVEYAVAADGETTSRGLLPPAAYGQSLASSA
jgi:NDP-sugar pyrophosphorylase family protein